MDPITPIFPAILIGGVAYLLKGRAGWWTIPVLVFVFSLGAQLAYLYNILLPLKSENTEIEVLLTPLDLIVPVLLTSIYLAVLSVLFTLAGVGVYRVLGKNIRNRLVRSVVAVYITLILLQLWAVVFPWTFAVPLRFYSLLP